MSELYLISTLLMGVFLIAVAVAVRQSGRQRTLIGGADGRTRDGFAEWSARSDGERSSVVDLANDPLVWTVSFVLLSIVFMAGAVALVTAPESLPVSASGLQTAFVGIGGAVLLGYVFFGTYFAVRDRSGQSAAAVGVSAAVLGLLMVVGVVAVLIAG